MDRFSDPIYTIFLKKYLYITRFLFLKALWQVYAYGESIYPNLIIKENLNRPK